MNAGPAEFKALGKQMHELASRLFDQHRAITGAGVRKSFEILGREIPLRLTEVPTGTKVFDWNIPQEWSLGEAYIADQSGDRVVDYAHCNLHVVNYSAPIDATLSWPELEKHIHHDPAQPEHIPYRTTYFRHGWGFCVNRSQLDQLRSGGPWLVKIGSRFFDGSLSIAESVVHGESEDEVLIHCHTCHPSLANDNLSGMVVATYLAKHLLNRNPRLSYRFVFAPATIGAIAWLAQQTREDLGRIKHGLVFTLLGDSSDFTYKKTSTQCAMLDRLLPKLLCDWNVRHRELPFTPDGYDERHYNSPGIALPVGRLSRAVHGEFSEYHTSADNLEFIRPEQLAKSLDLCKNLFSSLEQIQYPVNQFPFGEPQLGRHGIFRAFGERDDRGRLQEAIMWVLQLGDGRHNTLDIADRASLPVSLVCEAMKLLHEHDIIAISDTADPDAFDQLRDRH